MSARLIVGNYFSGYTDGFEERRYNLENEPKVTFSKFKLTKDVIGNASIKNGSLSIRIEGHTGGTTIEAETDRRRKCNHMPVDDSALKRSQNHLCHVKHFLPSILMHVRSVML